MGCKFVQERSSKSKNLEALQKERRPVGLEQIDCHELDLGSAAEGNSYLLDCSLMDHECDQTAERGRCNLEPGPCWVA